MILEDYFIDNNKLSEDDFNIWYNIQEMELLQLIDSNKRKKNLPIKKKNEDIELTLENRNLNDAIYLLNYAKI
jgi:hypothetical protein